MKAQVCAARAHAQRTPAPSAFPQTPQPLQSWLRRLPMRRLYLDNSATSFPKPREMMEAMVRYATEVGASAGRGAYAEARESARVIRVCRERLNELFHGENPNHFIFTCNCTDALNLAIQGMLKPGDHAITS